MRQHHLTAERKKNIHKLYFYIKKYKDKFPLTQILALYGFETGTSPWTMEQYKKQLLESGIVKVNNDKVEAVINIEIEEE